MFGLFGTTRYLLEVGIDLVIGTIPRAAREGAVTKSFNMDELCTYSIDGMIRTGAPEWFLSHGATPRRRSRHTGDSSPKQHIK
jgi:hypothetical protein